MGAWNTITSAIFDVLLAPWGHELAFIDLTLWSVLCGIAALIVYKYVSNQKGIERAKNQIKMHLLEVRLWRNDPRVVFGSTGKILFKNFIYVSHNLLPMVVMFAPFMMVLFQLEANYAFDPAPVGAVEVLSVKLDPDSALKATDVQLTLPDGVELDAPPMRTPDGEAFWRLKATAPGDHELKLVAGGHELVKGWAVGGPPRKVPVMRTRSLEGFLYPGEAPIPSDSPFYSARLHYPDRPYPWLPDGEMGVLAYFFGVSLLAGFALKDVFGVTL